jgi:hypothetical protein
MASTMNRLLDGFLRRTIRHGGLEMVAMSVPPTAAE